MIGGTAHHEPSGARQLGRRGRVEVAVLAGLLGVFAVVGVAAIGATGDTTSGPIELAPEAALVDRLVTASVTTPFGDSGRRHALSVDTGPEADSASGPARRVVVDIGAGESPRTWRGVGAALTDSSVTLLAGRDDALALLFDPALPGGAGLDLVRLPLSATDFSMRSWTWTTVDDTAVPTPEALAAIGVIDEVLAIRPDLEVLATAWTSPPEMRTDPAAPGGTLVDVDGYGALLTAQVDWLLERGVPLTAVSLGNEPGLVTDAPTLLMSDAQMVALSHELHPQLERVGVELLALDHNWSDVERAADLVADGAFDAVAFHCYDGAPSAMATLDTPVLVTECTATTHAWHQSVGWMARELVGNSIRAGSTGLVMWNLALDPTDGPKQPGGCTDCRGLLTIDPTDGSIVTTPEFSVLAHLAAAADPGATILDVEQVAELPLAAFVNPDGTIGVFGHNDRPESVAITFRLVDGSTVHADVPSWGTFSVRTPLDPTATLVTDD